MASLVEESGQRLEETLTPAAIPTVAKDTQGLVAAIPNISRNGEPIQFLVNLQKPAKIILILFNMAGEPIYSIQVQGHQGLNTLVWVGKTNAQQNAASGLYLYAVRLDYGENQEIRRGKVAFLH
jgi:hypothetical protein